MTDISLLTGRSYTYWPTSMVKAAISAGEWRDSTGSRKGIPSASEYRPDSAAIRFGIFILGTVSQLVRKASRINGNTSRDASFPMNMSRCPYRGTMCRAYCPGRRHHEAG
ncbi:MAG TPA: hypothetical protein VMI73_20150 [Trebonia sp.]|nr:hypothetical protein [Trebonia sp.]